MASGEEEKEALDLEWIFKQLATSQDAAHREFMINILSQRLGVQAPAGLAHAAFAHSDHDYIENRIGRLEAKYQEFADDIQSLKILIGRLEKLEEQVSRIRRDQLNLADMTSDVLASPELRLPRTVAASVYVRAHEESVHLGEDWIGNRIKRALSAACNAIGFELADEELPKRGSWFQRFRFRTVDFVSRKEVQERLAKIERALELKMIDGVQSKIDLQLSKAAVELTNALKHAEVGIISVGSLFVVKSKWNGETKIAILSLSQEQMKLVQAHPAMLTDPEVFHRILGTSTKEVTLAGDKKLEQSHALAPTDPPRLNEDDEPSSDDSANEPR